MHTYLKQYGLYEIGTWVPEGDVASFQRIFKVDDLLTALRAVNLLNGGDWDGSAVLHLMAKIEES